MTVQQYILAAISIAIESLCIYLIGHTFFPRKVKHPFLSYAVLFVLLITLLNPSLVGNGFLKYGVSILITTVWQWRVFRVSIVKSLAVTMLGLLYLIIVDGVFLAVTTAATDFQSMYNNMSTANEVFASYALTIALKLFELTTVAIAYTWRRRRSPQRSPEPVGWILVIIMLIPVLTLSIYYAALFGTDPEPLNFILLVAIVSLIAICGAIFILNYSSQKRAAERDNLVLRQNLKLESEHVASMEKAFTQQRTQAHDFKNRLSILRSLAEKNAPPEEFNVYLSSILETEIPAVLYINTHRTVVDIIISQKVPLAKDKGIDFQFQLDDLSGFPLPDDALVVVLTNLIDNAIEACEKIPPEGKRNILLKMKMEKRTAILNIENTTSGPVVIRYNKIKTTKSDPLFHGYGLKNVAAMLEQHNGMFFMEYREADKMFCFCASLPREA